MDTPFHFPNENNAGIALKAAGGYAQRKPG